MSFLLGWLLGGGAIPAMLMLCAVVYLIGLKGQPFRSPKKLIRAMTGRQGREDKSAVSPFRAVMLALAGTLGVGNIVGVANAVYIGGAGAVFWMWASAFLAMILKYAEIVLAVLHRRSGKDGSFFGGAVYYIRDFFDARRMSRWGMILSAVFAVFIMLDALSMGCVIQVNAVSMAAKGVWGFSPVLSGVILLLLTLPALLRGRKSVSAVTEILVPVMTGGYIILSVAVLIIKRGEIASAFSSIFADAFTLSSAMGGMMGFLTSQAVRLGTMRGLLSNEAGCGTSPTAHAAADAKSPAAQGVWGIFEVFVDTILLCTLTALVILVSYSEVSMLGDDSVMMTIRAYTCVLGDWAGHFFAAAIACFGYATLLCWANYGLEALSALNKTRMATYFYLIAFSFSLMLGCVAAPEMMWGISDFAIAVLTAINLCMLFLMRKEVKKETERFCKNE